MRRVVVLSSLITALSGCRSTPEPIAFDNRVFYQYDALTLGPNAFESPYPPLDQSAAAPLPEYVGVSIFGRAVNMSRPREWIIRRASIEPERRMIQYVSPSQYVVSLYERADIPNDLWRDIINRYEDDAKNAGAEIVTGRIPIATWNGQGRAYVVKRRIKAAKAPLVSHSREYLLRGEHRVLLVQIVHQTETPEAIADELVRFVQTIELL